MKTTTRHKITAALILWGIVGLIVASGLTFGWLEEMESRTWDWRIRAVANPTAADKKIAIVLIDQTSLEHFARYEKIYWPWPRSLYNPLLDFLAKGGARAVAFDLLFTESSAYVDDDKEFARAVSSTLPVVSAVALRSSESGTNESEYPIFVERQKAMSKAIAPYVISSKAPAFQSVVLPFEDLLRGSAALGNVSSKADDDQIFRRAFTMGYVHDTPVLSLPFAMRALQAAEPGMTEYLSEVSHPDGSLLVRFHGPAGTYRTYSFHALTASWLSLNEGEKPLVAPEEFKDAYVLIGANAPGLLDLRTVPFPGNYPGVEFHATTLDNILNKGFFRSVPWLWSVGASLVAIGVVVATAFFFSVAPIPALIVEVGVWLGACFYLAEVGWWMPMVLPLLGLLGAILGTSIVQYQIEGRQHRFIRGAFQYYISSEVIEKMVADPSTLRLGGERRELTIFFSDIKGFTGISERLAPERLVQFLNRFLSEMSSIVLEEGGTLDKYQGDAVIAFWNAPLEVKNHQVQAVRAALRCQQRLAELAPEFARDFGIEVKMRIGIHTGVVSVGNFGSSKRFNYTMIGDAANVASRLEGVNKVFGTGIIASSVTQRVAEGDFLWRRLGDVKVVGRKEPISVYEPMERLSEREDSVSRYHEALSLFERGEYAAAREKFEQLNDDPVAGAYLARIARMSNEGGGSSQVWDVTEK